MSWRRLKYKYILEKKHCTNNPSLCTQGFTSCYLVISLNALWIQKSVYCDQKPALYLWVNSGFGDHWCLFPHWITLSYAIKLLFWNPECKLNIGTTEMQMISTHCIMTLPIAISPHHIKQRVDLSRFKPPSWTSHIWWRARWEKRELDVYIGEAIILRLSGLYV